MSTFVTSAFQIENDFIDQVMRYLSPVASCLYLTIVRKTRGWQKEVDRISISQFQELSGVKSRATVCRAIAELVDAGLVDEEKDTRGNLYRISDTPLASLKNGLVQKLNQLTSSKIEPVLVQKLNQNRFKNRTATGSKIEHTKDILNTKDKLNTGQAQAKGVDEFVGDANKTSPVDPVPTENAQTSGPVFGCESKKPNYSLSDLTARAKPQHEPATPAELQAMGRDLADLYRHLRGSKCDVSHHDPRLIEWLGDAHAVHLMASCAHQTHDLLRGCWYTPDEMRLPTRNQILEMSA